MDNDLIQSLNAFHAALVSLRDMLGDHPEVRAQLLDQSEDLESLLRFKLLPQTAQKDCIVVALGGGTNTGKSTLFNLIAGSEVSPVRSTAAATCRPVVAANPSRAQSCYDGNLMPGFVPRPMERDDDPLLRAHAPNALFVAVTDTLPMSRILLDTPDVDSIDLANWEAAARLRAAGDIMLAVLTGEKYQDVRVVDFFREAAASGRIVLPIMNKANPERGYEIARQQLETFRDSIGLVDAPSFVVPHDYDILRKGGAEQIRRIDAEGTLRDYLDTLDPIKVKERVYAQTAARFLQQSSELLTRVGALADTLHTVVDSFEEASRRHAKRYDPMPGTAVGGLFHAFVQGKRGSVDRAIGSASRAFANGVGYAGRKVRDAITSRTLLQAPAWEDSEDKVRKQNQRKIEQISADLAANYLEQARTLGAPAAHLVLPILERMDIDGVTTRVARSTEQHGGITDDFRAHAERMLEAWWHDNRGKRMVIEALDKVLLVAPAGIAGVMSVHTAGVGVPEAMIVAGPLMEQFAARVMEYQFGDAMFDFISPWRLDQQEALERALREHQAHPVLEQVQQVLDALEERPGAELKRSYEACRAALETS
jgi:hypothetical protein